MEGVLLYALLLALSLGGGLYVCFRPRTALEVLHDLENVEEEQATPERAGKRRESTRAHAALGLFDRADIDAFEKRMKLWPLLGLAGAATLAAAAIGATPNALLPASAFGYSAGVLGRRIYVRMTEQHYKREVEFYLPIIMERLVMAVSAGFDVVSALTRVLQLEAGSSGKRVDGVTKLFRVVERLIEKGLTFDAALREASGLVDIFAFRHAVVHLMLAQEHGGELIKPLRELSDSTQLYFQQSVEEEIAKLPVKATLPLLCTFAGLIIFFVTTSLLQFVEMTKHLPKAGM